MVSSFVQTLLLGLCTNYPPSNETVTEPPPWKWVPEKKHLHRGNSTEFECSLKSSDQIKKELLKGKRLRVATLPDRAPLSYTTQEKNSTTIRGHGIAFEILNTLSEKFGFTYDVFVPERRTLINEKGGILHMLTQGEVDMIAAFIPILPGLQNVVQWGVELGHFEYVVMMKRPKESATGSGLLAPFEIEVWLLILVSLIIVGPIIHGIMRLRCRLSGGSKVYSLGSCIWFVYGALMKQGSSLSPDNEPARIMFASWWLFIMILTSFYTANLTAFLTLSRFTLPIQNVEDIANPIYRWAALEGDAIEYSVREDNDLLALRQSWSEGRGKFINTVDNFRIKPLIAEGVLLLHERNWLNFFMLNIERGVKKEKEHCKYVLTTKSYLTRSLSFAFPKHSILPQIFNSDMLSYVESGIIKHLLTKDLPEATICPLNLGSKERQLRSSDLFTTYAIIVAGFLLASAIFCAEMSRKLFRKEIKPSRRHRKSEALLFQLKNKSVNFLHDQETFVAALQRDCAEMKNLYGEPKPAAKRKLSAIIFQ